MSIVIDKSYTFNGNLPEQQSDAQEIALGIAHLHQQFETFKLTQEEACLKVTDTIGQSHRVTVQIFSIGSWEKQKTFGVLANLHQLGKVFLAFSEPETGAIRQDLYYLNSGTVINPEDVELSSELTKMADEHWATIIHWNGTDPKTARIKEHINLKERLKAYQAA